MLSNKRPSPMVTELFIRGRKLNISIVKLNISIVFITQYCIFGPKNIRLNYSHYFIIKIRNKREFQ